MQTVAEQSPEGGERAVASVRRFVQELDASQVDLEVRLFEACAALNKLQHLYRWRHRYARVTDDPDRSCSGNRTVRCRKRLTSDCLGAISLRRRTTSVCRTVGRPCVRR